MAAEAEGFVHLRVRSAYSLLEGAIKADAIGALAVANGMPAVALTDRANLFGALEFSVVTKEMGVQPIIGCALPVTGIGEGPPEALGADADGGPPGPERDRLAQPHRTFISRVPGCGGQRVAPRALVQGGGARAGPDPALRRRRTGRSTRCSPPAGRPRAARPWMRCGGCSKIASMWSCSATIWPARRSPSPPWWPGPTTPTRRSWPPTTSISPRRRPTGRTTRFCASPTAPSSARRIAGG